MEYGRSKFLNAVKSHLPDSPICCEIGTHRGDFARMILDILKPKCLVLIDPFETGKQTYGEFMDFLPVAYSTENDYTHVINRFQAEIIQGTVAISRKYSYDAVQDFPDGFFDFVYIDASHLYDDIKRDLNDWLPKVKHTGLIQSGIIAGHDFIHLNGFGVIKAVDEFMIENKMEVAAFDMSGGDWALKREN